MRQIRLSSEQSRDQAGFTILELMIATVVFTVILVIITSGVLHFSNDYYKGVNSSTTQTATADILNTVSQTIQFSKISAAPTDTIPGVGTYLCVGNKEFIYNLGVVDSSSQGLFLFDNNGFCYEDGSFTGSAGWSKRQDLLQPHMRITQFDVTGAGQPSSDTWNVAVRVAYGDSDLLCNTGITDPGTTASCSPGAPDYALTDAVKGDDVACKSSDGSQFCDVSALSTTVQTRLQ